ncbi:hypothetical protein Tco_0928933 [Tanacetum coccineum]
MPVTRQGSNDAMTPKSIQAMIHWAIQRNSTHTQDDASHSSGGGLRRPVQPARVCSYIDFMKCQPLNFKGTKGIVGLSQWLEKMESVFHISGCAIDNQGKKTKRRRTKELESSKKPSTTKETPKGKALSKGSKTSKYASAKELVEEPIAKVAMDDAVNTVGEDVDMTPMLWSTINHVYDKDAEKEDQALGRKAVKKLHGYGYLEEVVVKRADRQLYKFKEGDFMDLHLNDIEDMLLLFVQHKLFHLNESDIVDFIVALCMFTRSLVIKKHVEDLQLGVESYQKKLNITAPQKTFPKIKFKELYTPSYKPPGVIYEELYKQKRVMRADELYKFSDGTLKNVHDKLHHRILNFHLGYNDKMSRRKWTAIDKKRSELMVELIDKQI